mmetsp:Transcript_34482/g.89319  ORF Transcript_34482/g.89319 Transcript_34482/m.89319 type:complete len:90 (-) Transcript_34482:2090-2359(-)
MCRISLMMTYAYTTASIFKNEESEVSQLSILFETLSKVNGPTTSGERRDGQVLTTPFQKAYCDHLFVLNWAFHLVCSAFIPRIFSSLPH